DRQLLSTDSGVARGRHVYTSEQRGRAARGQSGRDALSEDPSRVGGRGRGERRRSGRRIDRHGRPAPSAGLHGADVLELDDRSVVAFPDASVALATRSIASRPSAGGLLRARTQSRTPHSAFRGQTPDEMYFGTGDAVPADLPPRAVAARRARVEANRSTSCETCPSLNAAA